MTWHAFAACRGMDPDVFFPTRGDNDGVGVAKAICDTCIVQADCLRENAYERDGIYAGTTGRQRRNTNKKVLELEFRCLECGRVFSQKSAANVVCSDDCRRVRHRRQNNESAQRKRQ